MNYSTSAYGLWALAIINSAIFIIFAFSFTHPHTKRDLLSYAWRVLYAAQKAHRLARTGPYSYVRHPQYAAFMLIMIGFLLQWPTLLTLLMFPILAYMYLALARREEREVLAEFGEAYASYAAVTPRFIPEVRRLQRPGLVKKMQ